MVVLAVNVLGDWLRENWDPHALRAGATPA